VVLRQASSSWSRACAWGERCVPSIAGEGSGRPRAGRRPDAPAATSRRRTCLPRGPLTCENGTSMDLRTAAIIVVC